ncbi:hypothetical protein [Psychrobacter sp. I-STPA6b]|uniref:hypothetical protein n=1 Tax=Psychrobacter sp. I-STPA6b TaxID=2585718 RepID=UPI001D0C32EC|nr:hypothetical protein [Psychrobacter sp. I-STPA6b]
MPNSNRNTSTNTPSIPNQTIFKAGDKVLCPILGNELYTLLTLPIDDRLYIEHNGSYRSFNPDGKHYSDDRLPELFHNTPANRQAIATLFGQQVSSDGMVKMTTPQPTRKVIDLTDSDDKEVIIISACEFSDTACDVLGAGEVMHDIGQFLWLIYNDKLSISQIKAMARLVHDTTDRWHSIMNGLLNKLNKPLERTEFGKVEG